MERGGGNVVGGAQYKNIWRCREWEWESVGGKVGGDGI
jgi:hypothetical protein